MNVNESHFNLNILNNNVASGLKTEGTVLSANAQIAQVNVGQIFNGKIIDITNSQVSIMLGDNKTLYANMAENLNINIGDSITFMVKEKSGSNVVIKPVVNQEMVSKDSTIFKILDMNNLSPTDKNYQIAESLMNHNMPVDRNSMQRIMQQSYNFPDTSIDTLVSLNEIGIPVNEATINQYNDYLTNTHQLMQNIFDMGRVVADFNSEQISQLDNNKDILAFSSELLSIISDEGDMANIDLMHINNNFASLDANSIEGNTQTIDISPEAIQQVDVGSNVEIADILSDKLLIDNDIANQFIENLIDAGIDMDVVRLIVEQSDNSMQLLNNINHFISNNDMLMSGVAAFNIKDLLASDTYKHILGDAVKEKLSIAGDSMKRPEEIDELYNKIYEKSNKLLDTFSGSGSELKQELQNSAKGMQERLDFVQNLNQMYAYAQIPVRLSGNDMNSELFVYMNKRNMKATKEAVSALLHLDMDHLGATDVHVSLQGTNVHTKFYVDNEISAKIIDQHMSMLEKAINENGFALTNEVITREPSITSSINMVVDEMLGNDMEQSVKRYSFDVRM